nr:reverse transcriptase domain-containing protein [Tanacetum cinerariifolium]
PTLVFDDLISESDSSKEPIVKSSSPTLTPFGENPFQLPLMDLKVAEESKKKSSVEKSPELELIELPSHLEYAFLEDSNKLPVIIAKNLKVDEREALINVLKSHKWAIAWKISDIKGIDPRFCTHKILMEEDYKPAVQSQRMVNPKIHDVIKKEVIKLLDAGMIYHISDSPLVSPIHCVPKKGGYFQIPIDPQDQEKTTFTCPYGTFAYRRMPFGLCNALEVDRAKVDVIAKLPHLTTVKGVRSFLGHAGFYRRFIQEFSRIARPMTHLLEKETPFVFSKECIESFNTLKKKLTEAPILVVTDWNLPFELMCDASDYAIGPVLGQPIDYLSKWVEAKALPTNDARFVFKFLKSLYSRFGIPRAIISDRGIHFCNYQFTKVMIKYGVTHRLTTAYHPQTSGQVEVSNRGLKRILERTVGEKRTSWFDKLDDALWAFRTAYKTPIGCTPYELSVGDHRKLQLNELSEFRDQAYENSVIYKERTKKLHDSNIKNRIFNVSDQVLLFNSQLKIFSEKLKTRWSGPFTITHVFPYGTIKLSQPNGLNFKVNGHRVKHYFGGDIPSNVAPDLHTFPMDN